MSLSIYFDAAHLIIVYIAVLLFEYLITLDREVHFAWGHQLSWARTLFLLNRYLSILEYLFVLGPILPTTNDFVSTSSSSSFIRRLVLTPSPPLHRNAEASTQ